MVHTMGGKIAIVIISDWDQKLKVTSGLHLAKRIYDVRQENDIENIEVFLFAGGAKLLQTPPQEFDQILSELRQAGIPIVACINEVKIWGLDEMVKKYDLRLEFARDAFSRYAKEGYVVLTF